MLRDGGQTWGRWAGLFSTEVRKTRKRSFSVDRPEGEDGGGGTEVEANLQRRSLSANSESPEEGPGSGEFSK